MQKEYSSQRIYQVEVIGSLIYVFLRIWKLFLRHRKQYIQTQGQKLPLPQAKTYKNLKKSF
jgi:hypothetical protein